MHMHLAYINMRIIVVCATAISTWVPVAGGANLYVSTSGQHNAPFSTWLDAATNIQAAVDSALIGDTIWVTNGVYGGAGAVDALSDSVSRSTNVVLVTKAIRLQSVNGPGVTIIDGDNLYRGIQVSNANAIISGFTIKNCKPHGSRDGAGLHIGSGMAEHLIVVSNNAALVGGGIYAKLSSLSNIVVQFNVSSNDGGGIRIETSTIDSCIVTHNLARQAGGGIYAEGQCIIRNTVISDNQAWSSGGLFVGGCIVQNTTIARNVAIEHGGGITVGYDAALLNCIIWSNQAGLGPNWFSLGYGFSATRVVTRPLADFMDGFDLDPRFADQEAGNYQLSLDSPCIDAGVAQEWMTNAFDVIGNPRIEQQAVDIGAHENNHTNTIVAITGQKTSGIVGEALVLTSTLSLVSSGWTSNIWYTWDIDGNQVPEIFGDNLAVVSCIYTNFGLYVPIVTVSNSEGITVSATGSVIRISPANLYASTKGNNIPPYDSWENAATSIIAAINLAGCDSTVWVTNGTYNEGTTMRIKDRIAVRSVNGPELTQIELSFSNRIMQFDTDEAEICGFTLRGGRRIQGSGIAAPYPGNAILACNIRQCTNEAALKSSTPSSGIGVSPSAVLLCFNASISNSIITDTYGGVEMFGGLIVDSTVRSNTASGIITTRGGQIIRTEVSYNDVKYTYPGGILGYAAGAAVVDQCRVIGNLGSGISLGYIGPYTKVLNNIVAQNTAGGMDLRIGSPYIAHNTIVSNGGPGIKFYYTVGGAVVNNIIYGNDGDAIADDCPVSTCWYTNLNNFTDLPGLHNMAQGDFSLMSNSPCIDAGALTGVVSNSYDGTERPLDGDANGEAIPDIGACEYINSAADSDGDGLNDQQEVYYGTSLINTDTSGNGMTDWEAWIAGTDPLDSNSLFELRNTIGEGGETNIVLTWLSVSGRLYSVMASSNIVKSMVAVDTNILATPPQNSWTSPIYNSERAYFSLEVIRP